MYFKSYIQIAILDTLQIKHTCHRKTTWRVPAPMSKVLKCCDKQYLTKFQVQNFTLSLIFYISTFLLNHKCLQYLLSTEWGLKNCLIEYVSDTLDTDSKKEMFSKICGFLAKKILYS